MQLQRHRQRIHSHERNGSAVGIAYNKLSNNLQS